MGGLCKNLFWNNSISVMRIVEDRRRRPVQGNYSNDDVLGRGTRAAWAPSLIQKSQVFVGRHTTAIVIFISGKYETTMNGVVFLRTYHYYYYIFCGMDEQILCSISSEEAAKDTHSPSFQLNILYLA